MRPSPPDSTLLLATRSVDKVREIRQILSGAGRFRILSLSEAGLPPTPDEDAIEQADTFRGNALAKALYFERLSGLPTLADDSGLCVNVLGGAPGIHSKRFAHAEGLSGTGLDASNNARLLDALAAIPASARTAHYVCAAVLARPGHAPLTALGTVSGTVLEAPRGHGGFGYDPLFLVPSLGLTFAEIDAARKHRFSHRGRAVRALRYFLRAYLTPAAPRTTSFRP